MKNNKVLIIIGVIVLNILVGYVVGQSLMGKESEYDIILSEARELRDRDLCSRAIVKYKDALNYEDSLELRAEILKVYEKGIDSGEIDTSYDIFSFAEQTVTEYRNNPKAYEAACDLFLKYNKYENCANILMQARDLRVSSDKINAAREQIRYQHTKHYSMYTALSPMFDGMYTAMSDGFYKYLNEDASVAIDGAFVYASSFSEGYAFVKVIDSTGEEKAFVINKSGQRYEYFTGVESSSGVGKAKKADGTDTYLLSCKTGEVYKYYTLDGKEAFGEYKFAGRFRNNVAAVKVSENEWKLINGAGVPINNMTYTDVILNEHDECAPKGFIFAMHDGKYHMYDLTGKQIGDFSCDSAKAFVDDVAAFKSGELWGFVDSTGKEVVSPQYEDAKSFSNGIGGVMLGQRWFFINKSGEKVIEETFDNVDYLNNKGICFVENEGHWSYLKMYYTGK